MAHFLEICCRDIKHMKLNDSFDASITSSLITPECFHISFLNTFYTISRNRNTIWSLNSVMFTGSQNNKATKYYYNTNFLVTVLLKLNSIFTSNHQVYVIYSYNYLHTHNQYIVPLRQSITRLDLSVSVSLLVK